MTQQKRKLGFARVDERFFDNSYTEIIQVLDGNTVRHVFRISITGYSEPSIIEVWDPKSLEWHFVHSYIRGGDTLWFDSAVDITIIKERRDLLDIAFRIVMPGYEIEWQ